MQGGWSRVCLIGRLGSARYESGRTMRYRHESFVAHTIAYLCWRKDCPRWDVALQAVCLSLCNHMGGMGRTWCLLLADHM